MPRLIASPAMFAIALLLCGGPSASAQVCQHCGSKARCHQVCRLVLEEKKVEVICWGCKCEDFCLPDHGHPGCKHCETVCDDDCGATQDDIHTHAKKFVWREWYPTCAKVFHRKRLMKRVVVEKVPSYKWVLEEVCDKCDAKCPGAALPPDGEIPPPPPVTSGTLRYSRASPASNSPATPR